MTPAAGQAQQQTSTSTAPSAPATTARKKFQVVPVPGEFSRGRWKCVDTRGGSATGVFGNYPKDNEYGSVITYKNNIITVRKKFYRRVKVEEDKPEELPTQSHITVLNSTNRVFNDSFNDSPHKGNLSSYHISPRQEVEVIIMSPPQPINPVTLSSQQGPISSNTVSTSNPSPNNITITSTSPPTQGKDDEEGLAATTTNTVVAIDNKIVQAMDLVKTHLTFAVREEVESLRNTITDLESRLASLREENRVLRENVSPEVLAFISANNMYAILECLWAKKLEIS